VAFHAEQAFVLGHELGLAEADALGGRALTLLLAAATRTRRRDDPVAARKLYERAASVSDRFPADPMSRAEAHGFAGLLRASQDAWTPEMDAALSAAYAIAALPGPSEVLLELTMYRAYREYLDDRVDTANDLTDEAVRFARATGDPELIGTALAHRATGWSKLGDFDRRDAVLVQLREHLAATGATRSLFHCLGLLIHAELTRGDFSEATRYMAERRAALPPRPSKLEQAATASYEAEVAYEIGDLDTALREAEASVADAREAGVPRTIGWGLLRLGETLIDLGDSARARRVLEEAFAIFEARDARARLPEVHPRWARACIRLGDLIAAREHVTAAQQHLLPGDASARQMIGVARAELAEAEGDLAAADAAWRDTLANLPSRGLEERLAWTKLLHGSFLQRHGRDAEARAQLIAAGALYRDPLAYRRVEQIDALLAKVSVSPSA
jgi:tetratricopeptide (TPR) repeat protein